ncbi:MAG: MATE family efflux transporter, partial [Bacteroidota bacterium]
MNKRILRLALPNVVSNLTVPLLGAVDAMLMGHQPDAKHFLAGVAIATAIFNAVYWGFGFLRMGTTGMTAQAFGAEDHRESLRILARGLVVALTASVFILALHVPLEHLGMSLMEGGPDAKAIGRSYYYVRIWAAPATLSLYVFYGWFFGRQDSFTPMFLSILINVANIGLNLLFVYGFGMQEKGIALATLIAQYLG